MADALAAVAYVRANATRLAVTPDRVGLLGFSAGAIITISAGLAAEKERRPDFIGVIYGSMNPLKVPLDAPPMFAAIALDDPLFAAGKSLGLVQAWREAKRPVEVHLYERGGHGFGMRPVNAATALWIEEFRAWLQDRGMTVGPKAAGSK